MIPNRPFFIQFTTLVMSQAPVIIVLVLCIICVLLCVLRWIWEEWKMTILLFVGAWYALHKQSLIQCLTSLLNSCKDHLKQMMWKWIKEVFPASFPTLKRFLSRGMTGVLRGGGMTGLLRGLCNIGEGIRGQFGREGGYGSHEDTDWESDDDESQGDTESDTNTDGELGGETDDKTDEDDKDTIGKRDGKPLNLIEMDYDDLFNPDPKSLKIFLFCQFHHQDVLIDGHWKNKPAKKRQAVKDFYTAWIKSVENQFKPNDKQKAWYKTYCDFYNDYCQTHPNFVQTRQNIFGPN